MGAFEDAQRANVQAALSAGTITQAQANTALSGISAAEKSGGVYTGSNPSVSTPSSSSTSNNTSNSSYNNSYNSSYNNNSPGNAGAPTFNSWQDALSYYGNGTDAARQAANSEINRALNVYQQKTAAGDTQGAQAAMHWINQIGAAVGPGVNLSQPGGGQQQAPEQPPVDQYQQAYIQAMQELEALKNQIPNQMNQFWEQYQPPARQVMSREEANRLASEQIAPELKKSIQAIAMSSANQAELLPYQLASRGLLSGGPLQSAYTGLTRDRASRINDAGWSALQLISDLSNTYRNQSLAEDSDAYNRYWQEFINRANMLNNEQWNTYGSKLNIINSLLNTVGNLREQDKNDLIQQLSMYNAGQLPVGIYSNTNPYTAYTQTADTQAQLINDILFKGLLGLQ